MNTLHVLNESPFTGNQLDNALLFAQPDDALILTGDAVYALQKDTVPYQTLKNLALSLFVLKEDLNSRAIQNSLKKVKILDYQGFVTLCIDYSKVTSWL